MAAVESVEEIADRLYGLPPAEFIKARNEAAGVLRKAGQREAADQVKALAKPTAAAAAVNRLVREHRGEVERFLRAAAALRDAQFAGKGDPAAATQQERQELDALAATGGETVRQTLLAAAADEGAARQLLEARLVRELELQGFGTLLAHADPTAMNRAALASAKVSPVAPERVKPDGATPERAKLEETKPKEANSDDRVAVARLGAATAALDAAEATERDARSRWERAQRKLDDDRAAAERAQAAAEEARRRVETARAIADKAQRELDRLHGR
jgi:hypothetical protein